MTSLDRPDDGLVHGERPRRPHKASEILGSRRLDDDELHEALFRAVELPERLQKLRASVDASRTAQVPVDPPLDVVNHALRAGPLDFEALLGDEDELSLVQQQRAVALV